MECHCDSAPPSGLSEAGWEPKQDSQQGLRKMLVMDEGNTMTEQELLET